MTRIAVLSDIHGNIHALEAVWEDVEAQQPDAVYCLGDLVGYGAFPNEVVEFIREREIPTIMGNYDEGVGFDLDDCGCVYRDPKKDARGKQSLFWSRQQTGDDNKAFLRDLPFQRRLTEGRKDLLLVHGSPRRVNEYLYEDRPRATFERLAKMAGSDVVFFGHTHIPYQKEVDGTWFVNTGSVGKPKDGDPRAGYLLAEIGRRLTFTHRRMSYPVAAAAEAVRKSQLPDEFAAQLETGGVETQPAAEAEVG